MDTVTDLLIFTVKIKLKEQLLWLFLKKSPTFFGRSWEVEFLSRHFSKGVDIPVLQIA